MDFKITKNEDESIKVQIEFTVFNWAELKDLMNKIEDEVGE